jgi:hypothetical protein
VVFAVTAVVSAVKLETLAPGAITSELGAVALALPPSVNSAPLAGAGPLSVTWHVDVAGGVTASGVHVMPVNVIPAPTAGSRGFGSRREVGNSCFETAAPATPAEKLILMIFKPLTTTV